MDWLIGVKNVINYTELLLNNSTFLSYSLRAVHFYSKICYNFTSN